MSYQKGNNTKITVDLGPVLYPDITLLAAELGISMASVVRFAVKELLEHGAKIIIHPAQGTGPDPRYSSLSAPNDKV